METNRATVVALNAEVRRIKARLMDEVPKLKKLSQRKVTFFVFFFLNFLRPSSVCSCRKVLKLKKTRQKKVNKNGNIVY